jgi:hypothetical protein
MKLHAIILTTLISLPAVAQETVETTAQGNDEYFEVTGKEDAKLDAIEKQPLSVTEKAHIAAMKRAGVTDNQVDPYTVDRYQITETGEVAVEPKESVIVYRKGGNKHEDRTDAVITDTKSFLYR